MGSNNINGRQDMDYSVAVLDAGTDNVPQADEYFVVIPQQNEERIVSFIPYDERYDLNWIFEAANGDPTQTMDVLLIGGLPAQDPPEIILPPGFTQVRITPGKAQRIAYIAGTGFVPLFSGVLE